MSVVEGKRIVFAGKLEPSLDALKNRLQKEEAIISCETCESISAALETPPADLLVMNFVTEEPACSDLLTTLQNSTQTKFMPVLTYVPNVDAKINRALTLGATDFFTSTEDIDMVLQKVKSNFGMPNTFAGVASVDITEQKVTATEGAASVYVVEDDPLLRALLSTKFEMSNVRFDFSHDGMSVEDKIRTFKPTVILLDIMIGAINGLDILEDLKKVEDLKNIPVVVFSNQDSDEERERAAALGANDYLVKATTDLSDLVKVLNQYS